MFRRVLKIALLLGAVVMILLQLVPVNHTNPVAQRKLDFIIQ